MDHLVSDTHLIVGGGLLEHFKYFPWSRVGGMETGVGNFLPEYTTKTLYEHMYQHLLEITVEAYFRTASSVLCSPKLTR